MVDGDFEIHRGDILLVNFGAAAMGKNQADASLGEPIKGEAAYRRPAIVVTNNIANAISPAIVVIPITSQNLENIYPFELELNTRESGLDFRSKAQIPLIRHISRYRIVERMSRLDAIQMLEIDSRIRLHLGLD